MKDLKEKHEGRKQQEDSQEQEIQRLKGILNEYEVETLVNNPRTFNKWLLMEVMKLKEAINQIGEGLDTLLSEQPTEEPEPEEETEEPEPEEETEEEIPEEELKSMKPEPVRRKFK